MNAKGKAGLVCLCLGAILLIGALGLYQSNRHEALEAEIASREVMTQLVEVITSNQIKTPLSPDEPTVELPPDVLSEVDTTTKTVEASANSTPPPFDEPAAEPPLEVPLHVDTTMKTVEVDGNRYVGFLTIPALELELPVMDDWNYERMRIAPCRYSGTLLGGDLVIAAHNYLRHFGHLMELTIGSEVLFTDISGNTTRYRVAELEILGPSEIERMTAGDYDLSLFTCTYGGANRFTVRCVRKDG